MHATVNGHSDIVGLLLENGAQANASVDGETTPMTLAVRSGQAQVIPVLIRGGANVLQQDSDGFTAFSRACQSGQISVVSAAIRTLLEVDAGQSIVASLKMTNNAGENPQDLAAKNGHWVVGDLLIQVGFDTYQEQDENEIDTVEELLADSSLDDDAIVNYLIEQEIDLHGTNADGEGLLFPVVVNERLGVVKYLLANGADPEHLGSRNWSTLMFASSEGQTEIVGELIQWKASVNFTDSCGIGALWLAAQSGECDTIMCLLGAGADINIQDAKGASPLHVAIANGHKEAVNLLIQRHANVHLQDLDGLTPLILAALEGHSAIVAALLRAGSDYRHQLNLPSGGDALYHAAARGHESVVRILIDAGADPNAVTLSGYTALLGATAADNIGISCLLLNNGANPNIQSVGGQTALHHAVIRRNMSIVSILAEAGADVSIEDNNGCSAFEIAVIMGEFELADFLEDLPGTKPLHPDDKFGVWPVSVLLEFYNQDNTKMESVIPQWYIDPSTIEEFAPLKQDLRTTALVADGF